MIVANSDFLVLSYLEENQIIKVDWKSASSEMSKEDFKMQVHLENDAFNQYKPSCILGQTQNLSYTISPQEQDWHNEIILPTFKNIGLKKMAIVVSADFFAQISVNQILDEDVNASYKTQYFEDEMSALDWLKEN